MFTLNSASSSLCRNFPSKIIQYRHIQNSEILNKTISKHSSSNPHDEWKKNYKERRIEKLSYEREQELKIPLFWITFFALGGVSGFLGFNFYDVFQRNKANNQSTE